jgi:dUTP pyrophosphatase
MRDLKIMYKKLHSRAKMPTYATQGDAACDLYAVEHHTVGSGQMCLVPLGFAIEIPEGFEAQIRPRSGLAVKNGVTVLNSPGTIDSGYRGEIKVPIINFGDKPFMIKPGDRVAQMKFAPVYMGHFLDIGDNELTSTVRNHGGFGHTGV